MENPNDMENVGVSRVEDIDDADSPRTDAVAGRVGAKVAKKASAKRKRRDDKDGGDGSDGGSASNRKDGAADDADDEKDEAREDAQDVKDVAKNMRRGAAVADAGVKSAMVLKFMNLMHMAVAMLGNFAASLGSFASGIFGWLGQLGAAISAGVANLASGAVSLFTSAVSFVSSAFGLSAGASTAAVVSFSITGALVATFVVSGIVMSTSNSAQRDGRLVDCRESVERAVGGLDVNADAQQLQNAQNIYSILKTYGLSNEQVAGVLGNFTTESSIDPTTIEGIYDEDYNIAGPRHQDAMRDWDAYVRGPLSDAYSGASASGGPVKNPGGYTASDGKMYPGIGMGQYTGGGAYTFLNFAQSTGSQWYTVEFQLAYTLAKGAPASGSGFWERYRAQSGNARDMARYFSQYWEGNTVNGFPSRLDNADAWLAKMSNWSVNSEYANNVIALAEKMGSVATENDIAGEKDSCVRAIDSDNSSIANAAVSFAYETKDEGRGNNGTELYQRVHDYIWPGQSLYMSCDITVASAVRWSGADDEYPPLSTALQLGYLLSSEKWEEVGMLGDLSYDKLMPGDVLCLDGHTLIFTGTEAVKAKYPNSNGNSVSGSYGERSPGIGQDTTHYLENHGMDSVHNKEYHVFRCVKPDNSSTYANAGK